MGSKKKTVTEKYNSILAVRLRETMDNKVNGIDLSSTQLANAIGVSRQTICNYRNGESVPDAVNLCRIARVYSISPEYLTGLTSSYSTDKDKRFISDELGFNDDMIDRILAFKDNEYYSIFLKIVDVLLQDKIYLRIVYDLKNKTDKVSKEFENRKEELNSIMNLLESQKSLKTRTRANNNCFEELDTAYDHLIRNYSRINESIASKEIEQFNLQMHLIKVVERILGTSNRDEYFEVRETAESLDVRLTLLRGKAIKAFENQENLCKYSPEAPVSLSNPWRE